MKLLTIWTVGKAEVGRVRGEKKRSEKIREERNAGGRKGRKVAVTRSEKIREERRCRCAKR